MFQFAESTRETYGKLLRQQRADQILTAGAPILFLEFSTSLVLSCMSHSPSTNQVIFRLILLQV